MLIAPPAISCSSHVSRASISTEPLRQVLNLPIRGVDIDSQDVGKTKLSLPKVDEIGELLGQEDDDMRSTATQASDTGASLDSFDDEIEYMSRTPGRIRRIPYQYHDDITKYITIKPPKLRLTTKSPGQVPQQHFEGAIPSGDKALKLSHLPGEIQETILEGLLGSLSSISCSKNDGSHGTKNWSSIMRHPRRRQISDLALISPTWRRLVQQRIYRHGE